MAFFINAKQSSCPSDHHGSMMKEINYMCSTSVGNYDQESLLGNIRDDVLLEIEHVRNTIIDERNEDNDDDIILEDSSFVPKINDESSIEDATNRSFQQGQIFKDENDLYEHLKSFGIAWGFSVL